MTASYDRPGELYDYAVAKPEGFTAADAIAEFGWTQRQFEHAVRALRLVFAGDTINLVCDPQSEGGGWLYRLVGTYEDISSWSAYVLQHSESRLETIEAVVRSVVSATDGRTTDGKLARLIHGTVKHLWDQLRVMSGRASAS